MISSTTQRWVLAAGIGGPAQFTAVAAAVGWVRPGYSSIAQPVSELGVGPLSGLLNASLVVLGGCLVVFAVGFVTSTRGLLPRRRSRAGAVLLALPGFGFAVAGLIPLDSPVAVLHWVVGASLVFYPPPVVLVLVGMWMRRAPALRAPGRLAVGAGLVLVPLVVAMYLVFAPGSPFEPWGLGGLVERLVFTVLLGWYFLAAVLLLRRRAPIIPATPGDVAGTTPQHR
jgi:Protein of unknown function (DUF998)